jgi:hypothetical protein
MRRDEVLNKDILFQSLSGSSDTNHGILLHIIYCGLFENEAIYYSRFRAPKFAFVQAFVGRHCNKQLWCQGYQTT